MTSILSLNKPVPQSSSPTQLTFASFCKEMLIWTQISNHSSYNIMGFLQVILGDNKGREHIRKCFWLTKMNYCFLKFQQRKTILRTQGCFVVKTFNLRTYQRVLRQITAQKRMFSKSIFFLVSEVFQNSQSLFFVTLLTKVNSFVTSRSIEYYPVSLGDFKKETILAVNMKNP